MWWTRYYKHIQGVFEGKNYSYSALYWKQKPDVYFPKYKLGIEVDEYDHPYRDPNYEQSRQLRIEGHGITVIRTNPEAPNCINRLINQIYMHKLKNQQQKELIDDLSKRLLELEFKSNHSIKSKCLKWIVKKILPII